MLHVGSINVQMSPMPFTCSMSSSGSSKWPRNAFPQFPSLLKLFRFSIESGRVSNGYKLEKESPIPEIT